MCLGCHVAVRVRVREYPARGHRTRERAAGRRRARDRSSRWPSACVPARVGRRVQSRRATRHHPVGIRHLDEPARLGQLRAAVLRRTAAEECATGGRTARDRGASGGDHRGGVPRRRRAALFLCQAHHPWPRRVDIRLLRSEGQASLWHRHLAGDLDAVRRTSGALARGWRNRHHGACRLRSEHGALHGSHEGVQPSDQHAAQRASAAHRRVRPVSPLPAPLDGRRDHDGRGRPGILPVSERSHRQPRHLAVRPATVSLAESGGGRKLGRPEGCRRYRLPCADGGRLRARVPGAGGARAGAALFEHDHDVRHAHRRDDSRLPGRRHLGGAELVSRRAVSALELRRQAVSRSARWRDGTGSRRHRCFTALQ